MKHGILITAYTDFENIVDLLNYFDDDFYFFIHIDKKSTLNDSFKTRIINDKKVKLLSQDFPVNWAGINHLLAILLLCKTAVEFKELEYFHLISGSDYPIKPLSHIKNFFKENRSNDYIHCEPLPLNIWKHGGYDRIEYFHLYDYIDAKGTWGFLIHNFVRLQKLLLFKRKYQGNLPKLYGGIVWWSLSRNTLVKVINYTNKDDKLLKRLYFTFCSEEFYFQTVLKAVSHSNKNLSSNNLRYTDWTLRNGNNPAILDISDFDKIMNSDAFFARKFDSTISIELKSKIQSIIRSNF